MNTRKKIMKNGAVLLAGLLIGCATQINAFWGTITNTSGRAVTVHMNWDVAGNELRGSSIFTLNNDESKPFNTEDESAISIILLDISGKTNKAGAYYGYVGSSGNKTIDLDRKGNLGLK